MSLNYIILFSSMISSEYWIFFKPLLSCLINCITAHLMNSWLLSSCSLLSPQINVSCSLPSPYRCLLPNVLTIICDVLPSSLCLSHSPWRTPKPWADITWDKVKHIVILGDKSGIKEKITFGWKKVGKTCSQIRSTLTSFRCGVLAFLSPPAGGKISQVGIFRLS